MVELASPTVLEYSAGDLAEKNYTTSSSKNMKKIEKK